MCGCAGMCVSMHPCVSVSLWLCKSPGVCCHICSWFPAGGLLSVTVQRYVTHQFSGLGRLQDLWGDEEKRETKKVRDVLSHYHQCLSSFTRYKSNKDPSANRLRSIWFIVFFQIVNNDTVSQLWISCMSRKWYVKCYNKY